MNDLKLRLRKLAWLYRLNARLKCWQTKRSYRVTLKHYAGMQPHNADTPLASSYPIKWRAEQRRPRIFFMGTD